SFDYVPAGGAVAEALGVANPDLMQRAVRVRSVDSEPFSYLTTHGPERIGAGLAVPAVADALGVKTGSPLIEMTRIVYDGAGAAVEHLHALYRPDRYSLVIDLA